MGRFIKSLMEKPMSLLVSLPENSVDMAKAAEAGGADGLKVHINIVHRASGIHYGSLADEKENIAGILEAVDIPVGIVPGAEGGADPAEISQLKEMGIDFVDMFIHFFPPFLLKVDGLDTAAAIDSSFDPAFLEGVNKMPVSMVEGAIVPKEKYGQPLTLADLVGYSVVAEKVRKPVIIPSQKALKPGHVEPISATGARAIMIGVLSTGKTFREIEEATRAFRKEIDRLTC